MFEYTVCSELTETREKGRDAGCSRATRPFSLWTAWLSLTFEIFTNPQRIYVE